jgi:hypothetical protein
MSRLRVCAVLRERPAVLPEGPSGRSLTLVDCGPLVIAAEAEPQEEPPTPESLARHDAVMRALSAQVPSLLPARFGWMAEDADSLRASVEPHRERLMEALDLAAGREQMTLRVYGPRPAATIGPPSPVASDRPGTRYLEARREEGLRRSEVPEIAPLRDALRPLVRAERVERHPPGGLPGRGPALQHVATVHHLVDRGRAEDYRGALVALADRLAPVQVTVTGPWAAYAYAAQALR